LELWQHCSGSGLEETDEFSYLFSESSRSLLRVSYKYRNEEALAFFGAVNKYAQIQSLFLKVRRFLGSVFVGTKMEQIVPICYFSKVDEHYSV
jgi:hypothetical protein